MKKERTSLIIIAHNEEAHIDECLASIVNQSKKADEIILIAHNCTDKTIVITSKYPDVIIHKLHSEEKGPLYARKYGFEKVTGGIIACIDGDGIAHKHWFERITQSFINPEVVGVGGRVWFIDNFKGNISSLLFFISGFPILKRFFPFYFWGANFACRKSIYDDIGGFSQIEKLPGKLGLNYPAEDALLSFLLSTKGEVIFCSDAVVHVYPGTFFKGDDRGKKQRSDFRKIFKYFRKK